MSTARLERYFPIFSWIKQYTREHLHSDVFAGIITAILLVPQGIAYAMLAGLPAQMGLYASLLPAIVYALLGTSRTLSVGPVSIAAIMIASILSAPELAELGSTTNNALVLTIETGLILWGLAALRMGGLVNFISHPVLTGFTSGAALLIVLKQIRHLLGLPKPVCSAEFSCWQDYVLQTNQATLILSVASVVVLLFYAKILGLILKNLQLNPAVLLGLKKSAPLCVIVVATIFVSTLQLSDAHNVKIVGDIQSGLPTLHVSFFHNADLWLKLLPGAIFIAMIAYVESVAIAKVTVRSKTEKISPNQELIALGTANIASAFTGGMAVAGGFSRTMVNFSAGARSQMATLIAVVLLSIAVVTVSEQFQMIPKAALAAIILVAIFPLIKISDFFKTWKFDKGDGVAEVMTFLGVLALGIEEGVAVGVVATIGSYLWKTSHPHIAVVGQVGNTEHFRNVKNYQVSTWPSLLLVRIDSDMTFANVNYIVEYIEDAVSTAGDRLEHVVLVCSSISDIDTTAFEGIENLHHALSKQQISLNFTDLKYPVIRRLERTDFLQHLAPGRVFFNVLEAVETLLEKKKSI